MAKVLRAAALVLAAGGLLLIHQGHALAQAAPPASAAFPPEPAAAANAPPVTTPPQNTAPGPLPTPPVVAPASAPVYTPPPSAPPSAPAAAPAYPEPQPYETPPPPPPQKPDEGFQRPEVSVRIDPFNLLLEGRLGLEIESQLYKSLTLELVPVFVTTQSPPTLNYETYEKSTLHQSSNGLGAISGAAIDAGIWFGGKPFNGTVLRAGFTDYAYTYTSNFGANGHDEVSHTDRQFFAMIGSHNRWGAFTIAGGFGIAYELNKQNRCLDSSYAPTSCDKDRLQIQVTDAGPPAELHPFLYPFDLMARFSLGVVF